MYIRNKLIQVKDLFYCQTLTANSFSINIIKQNIYITPILKFETLRSCFFQSFYHTLFDTSVVFSFQVTYVRPHCIYSIFYGLHIFVFLNIITNI